MYIHTLPLVVAPIVVGSIFKLFTVSGFGPLPHFLKEWFGYSFNYGRDAEQAFWMIVFMDIWHWTSLVALLAFAGLTSVPAACYQAAELDGASKWQVFRHVELPRLRGVLVIAVLLRLMDSFMIYTEPFVLTGGGPGNTTTFLSQYLATMAVGQFDLGPAAAFSVIYFLFILLFSWLFYTSVMRREEDS